MVKTWEVRNGILVQVESGEGSTHDIGRVISVESLIVSAALDDKDPDERKNKSFITTDGIASNAAKKVWVYDHTGIRRNQLQVTQPYLITEIGQFEGNLTIIDRNYRLPVTYPRAAAGEEFHSTSALTWSPITVGGMALEAAEWARGGLHEISGLFTNSPTITNESRAGNKYLVSAPSNPTPTDRNGHVSEYNEDGEPFGHIGAELPILCVFPDRFGRDRVRLYTSDLELLTLKDTRTTLIWDDDTPTTTRLEPNSYNELTDPDREYLVSFDGEAGEDCILVNRTDSTLEIVGTNIRNTQGVIASDRKIYLHPYCIETIYRRSSSRGSFWRYEEKPGRLTNELPPPISLRMNASDRMNTSDRMNVGSAA